VSTIKIIDITHELNDSLYIYEGDPHIRIEQFFTVENNGFAITKLSMGSHSGSHIDAPGHMISGGRFVTDVPLAEMVGPCAVVEKSGMKIPSRVKRVIIKGHDEKSGRINEQQAMQLVEAGVRLIGTNSLSVGSDEVHRILLGEGCVILEYLDLSGAETGLYTLCALPLKIAADGAPMRACLIKDIGEE